MNDKILVRLHEASLELLARTGVRVQSARAREVMAGAGVRVISSSGRAHPSRADVERALASAPRAFRVFGRGTDRPLEFDGAHTYFLSGGASLRVLELDGSFAPATLDHLRRWNRLLDGLPLVHMLINQVDPAEFQGPLLYRLLAAEMLAGTPKPICFQASSARDVEAMLEMGRVLRGSARSLREKPVYFVGLNSEPPLSISADIAEAFMHSCVNGIPCSLGNYNMMGITAPRTVAGAVVQLNALQLAAIVLAQACTPGAPVFYTAFCGSGDMKTLDIVSSDPLAVQEQRLTAAMGRYYGLPVYGFAGTDARLADPQAAAEHAFQFGAALEAGINLLQGPFSMMDQMMSSSFAQAVIDHDILSWLLDCRAEPPFDAECLGLEVIDEVSRSPELAGLKFAAHEHTVRHMADGAWAPLCFRSHPWSAWEKDGRRTLQELACESAARIIREHVPAPLPPDQEREIRAIVAGG